MTEASVPAAPRSRGPSFFNGFIWTFWFKSVIFYRIAPIVVLSFLTYNVWGYSYSAWFMNQYRSGGLGDLFYGQGDGDRADVVLLLFVGAILLGLWGFLLTKAWQGVGGRWYKAILVSAPFGLFVWLLTELGVVPGGGSGLFVAIQATASVLVGFCFSLNFIDRKWTGTIATTDIQDDSHDHGDDDGHH